MNKILNASDKIAIVISVLCVMHCIALPLILIALPSVTALLALSDEQVHLWLVFAVIPISLFAIIWGYRKHSRLDILLLSATGLLMLLFAVLLGHDLLGGPAEVILTLVGSVLIALGHFSNYKLRKSDVAAI